MTYWFYDCEMRSLDLNFGTCRYTSVKKDWQQHQVPWLLFSDQHLSLKVGNNTILDTQDIYPVIRIYE